MTEKIEWYKEVLELEPNSKVFFPLARLLADNGQEEEAMALLEKGLERHPEYLEARLLRIELLYKDNRRDECNVEIGRLNKMFASYAGFWQAWAACLASEEGQADTASLLRFLAAHFISGPLQLHEVLNRGLDAMARDGTITRAAPEPAQTDSTPQAAFEKNSEVYLEDLDSTLEAAAVACKAVPDRAPAAKSPEDKGMTQAVAQKEIQAETPEAALPEASAEEALLPEVETADSAAPEGAVAMQAGEAQPEVAMPEPELQEVMPETVDEAAPPEPEGALPEAIAEDDLLPEVETADLPAAEEAVAMQAGETQPEAVMPEPELQEVVQETVGQEAMPEPEEALPEAAPEDELLPEVESADLTAVENAVAAQDSEAQPEAAISEPGPQEVHAEALETAGEAIQSKPEEALPEAIADDELLPEIEAEAGELRTDVEAESAGTEVKEAQAGEGSPQPAVSAAQAEEDMIEDLELPDMEIGDLPVDDARGAKLQPSAVHDASDGDEIQEEPFSLRTRSMAEVLAEQGDIQGALDIYHELAEAATSGDEVEDINHRIATLSSRLSMANASAGFKSGETETAEKSKEKLIGMLEALVQRVEARAHG